MSRNFMVSLPCAILSHVPYTRPNPYQELAARRFQGVQVLETHTNRNRVPLSFLSQTGSNNFNVTLIEPGDPRRSGLRASAANILGRAVKVTGCGTAGVAYILERRAVLAKGQGSAGCPGDVMKIHCRFFPCAPLCTSPEPAHPQPAAAECFFDNL